MRKLMMLFAFLGLFFAQGFAQKTITGKVTDAKSGSPLPGVSVIVKGTTNGTITGVDGTYSLSVPENAKTLVFSFVGYKTLEIPITGNVVNAQLEEESIGLDKVVVTALGISREEKSLGYAVQEVNGDDVSNVQTDNFVTALSGKLAGVQIQVNTNMGGTSNVIIRGASSLTGNNQALFVVDGVPISNAIPNDAYQAVGGRGYDYGNMASDINPEDIESITVLKGAAATALYGSRAANGVVLITTKKAKERQGLGVKIHSAFQVGIIDNSTFPQYQQEYGAGYGPFYSDDPNHPFLSVADIDGDGTPDYYVPFSEDASFGEKFDPNLEVFHWDALVPESPYYMKKKPWVAAENGPRTFFSNSYSLTNSAEIAGGDDRASFRLSYRNMTQTGIMPNSKLARNNVTVDGSYNVTKKFKVTAQANYINTAGKGRNETGYSGNIMTSFRQWWQTNVDILEQKQIYEETGRNVTWNWLDYNALVPIYWNNYWFQRYENYETDGRDRLIGYVRADWDITKHLNFMARYALDAYHQKIEERLAQGSVAEAFGVGYPDVTSGYSLRTLDFKESNIDFMLKYQNNFGDLSLLGLVGANFRHTSSYQMWASTNGGLSVPDIYALSNSLGTLLAPVESMTNVAVYGYFTSMSLGYKDLLFLDLTARVDQSSTLPVENNTYLYPSASFSFLFSNLIDSKALSYGKLRFNYAEVGNSAPFASLYNSYSLLTPFNGVPVAEGTNTMNNPELRPERTKSLEAGLEMKFMNNRLGLDVSLYKNNSIDQIIPIAVSYATGYSSRYINAGNIENKGIEVLFTSTPVQNKNFSWDITVNWSKNVNKVIELAEGIDNLQLARLQGGISINARVGEPYGTIQGTDFVYDDNGNKIVNEDGYYLKTPTSDVVIGNIQPDWLAGIRQTLTYKGLRFSFLVDFKHGGDLFSLDQWYGMGTGLYPETAGLNDLGNPVRDWVTDDETSGGVILDGVKEDGTPNDTRIYAGWYAGPWGWKRNPNKAYIYDAGYIKLREVSLAYTVPGKVLGSSFIKSIDLGVTGYNLWIISKSVPYADPEASQGGTIMGWQSGVMPATRNIGFNVNIKF